MAAMQSEGKSGELAISPGNYAMARPSPPWIHRIEEHPSWPVLSQVSDTVVAYIQLSHFTLGHLMSLEKGKVFTSKVLTSDLVPVKVGSVRLVWGEFEMVNNNLALRVTKLA